MMRALPSLKVSTDDVHLSVISPVYRAEDCLHELVRRLRAALSGITESFEIVLIDDCSPDGSWGIINALAREDPRIRGILLSRNFGQHHAVTAGLQAARGSWAVVMDCDLQDRPEEIPRLYALAREGHACVMARRARRADGVIRRYSSWVFYRIFNYLADLDYDGRVSNFSIISRQVIDELNRLPEAVRYYPGFLAWLGFAREFIDVQHDPRFAGRSSYTLGKLVQHSAALILAYSTKPLRLCVTFGLAVSLLSFAAGVFYLGYVFAYGTSVQGWPSLIISLYLMSGVTILTLGLVGLYVGKIFAEVKQRPLFVVSRRTFET